METLEVVLMNTKLQWLHNSEWTAALVFSRKWEKKPGRPRKYWIDTLMEDLHNAEMMRNKFGENADNDQLLWKGYDANIRGLVLL